MTIETIWPWAALLLLGGLHGINPGMGWLFAVALGLQERRAGAVWRSLAPLAAGHALAIAAALAVAALVGLVVPLDRLKWIVAGTLLVVGVHRLLRHRHPRFGGMRVGPRELTIWSFLMASAHGAGLMVLPLVVGGRAAGFGGSTATADGADHAAHLDVLPGAMAMTGSADQATHLGGPLGASMAAPGDVAHHSAGLPTSHDTDLTNGLTTLLAGMPEEYTAALGVTLVHTLGYLLVTGVVAVVVYEKLGLRLLRTAWINLDVVWAGALIATALATPFL